MLKICFYFRDLKKPHLVKANQNQPALFTNNSMQNTKWKNFKEFCQFYQCYFDKFAAKSDQIKAKGSIESYQSK